MDLRRRRFALGLRGRIVGAVVITTLATLGVAAVGLLGPLEQELRNKALTSLERDVGKKQRSRFARLDVSKILTAYVFAPANSPLGREVASAQAERSRLTAQRLELANHIGVAVTFVNLLGFPDASGHLEVIAPPQDSEVTEPDTYDDATRAYLTRRLVPSFGSIGGTEYARVAVPITIGGAPFVLVARKPIEDIPGVVHVVRTAFLYAAAAGLVLTLILAIPLAATLVRRLRRLSHAALRVARSGPGAGVPVDRARDEVGDLTRAFAIMEQRLQHQEEARRAFVATASHELRTPLTSLEGMLELLDEDLGQSDPDLDDARSLVGRARAQSRRLGRLAADLLDLSRIDAEVQLRSEPVELGELSRAVIAEFELGTAERGLNLALDDERAAVWATCDPGSVARILRILLENAVRISPPGGEIVVTVRNGTAARLSVSDEGPGVAAEERELIFQRFKRGRETGGQAGFGLGLAIGRELAERMAGDLALDNLDAPGATFTLTLPAARAPQTDSVAVG